MSARLSRRALLGATSLFVLAYAGPALAQQTVVNFLAEANDFVYAPVIEAFEAANPDIDIQYQQVPFEDLNAAIESRVGQGDSSIDVFAVDTPRVPAFASRGYLPDEEANRAAIEAAVPGEVDLEQVSWEGKLHAFPMWTSTQLMFYNRDLLEHAGLPEPSSASPEDRMTWEEVLEQGKAAQDAGAEWGVTFQQVDRYYQLQALFESAGAGPGLTGDGLLTPDLMNEGWVKTAEWYRDLYENGLAPRGVTPNQTNDLFINGEVAFFIGGPWTFGRFEEAEGLNYGVTYVPYFEGGTPATPTGSWGLAINPSAAHPEEARKFVEYATLTAEGAYKTTESNPLPPVNAEAYQLWRAGIEKLTAKVGPAIDIITHELQETAVGRPRTVGFVAFETVMNRMFSDLRNGAEVQPTLQAAQDQLTTQLARIR